MSDLRSLAPACPSTAPRVSGALRGARAFACGSGGVVSLGTAIGGAALLASATACFDLYAYVKADAAAPRTAVVMAEYVSRETAPDGNQITALAEFLAQRAPGAPLDLVSVTSAIHKPPNVVAEVRWSDEVRVGTGAVTATLSASCAQMGAAGGPASLPAGFTMADDEFVIVTEICLRPRRAGALTSQLLASSLYGVHLVPIRDPAQVPPKPTRKPAQSGGGGNTPGSGPGP